MKKHHYYISGIYHLQPVADTLRDRSVIEMPDYYEYVSYPTSSSSLPISIPKTLKYIRMSPVIVFDTEYNFWFLEGTHYTIPRVINDLISEGIRSWGKVSNAAW